MERSKPLPDLKKLLAADNRQALRAFCAEGHPAAAASALASLEPSETWSVLQPASPERRSEIFSHLDDETQLAIVEKLTRNEIAGLFAGMEPDDRAHLFRMIPDEAQDLLMPALAQAEREDIRRLAGYPEGTAGSIMTSDYVTLPPDITAEAALDRLRLEAPDKETIYYSYVVDAHRKLLGFLSLRDLILARRDQRVGDLYHSEFVSVRADEDQEEVARVIQKYDLIAIPVVNAEAILVGIVTYDDAIDVITQEYTEDFEKLMAIAGRHEPGRYLRMSPWEHFRNRAGWVTVLGCVGIVSGIIVQHFETLLQQLTILAAFMPMLADAGGNTGSQAAALVMRSLALKEIETRDAFRILLKEVRVSILLALMLGLIAFARVLLYPGDIADSPVALVGCAIALALALQVVSATLLGAMLPLLAVKVKQDPAVVASPVLTTVVDITGLLIYFSVARAMLG